MKLSFLSVALLPLFAGCLSPAPMAPVCWTIDKAHSSWPPANIAQTLGDVRISRVSVSAPYNGSRMVILRRDGSIAFDAFNSFAVSPSALLDVAAQDAVRQCGPFKHTLPAASSAKTPYALEFDVTTLALDCREQSEPKALIEMKVALIAGRDVIGIADARVSVEAKGDYSSAFSTAFFHAVADALSQLPIR